MLYANECTEVAMDENDHNEEAKAHHHERHAEYCIHIVGHSAPAVRCCVSDREESSDAPRALTALLSWKLCGACSKKAEWSSPSRIPPARPVMHAAIGSCVVVGRPVADVME